MYGVFIVSAVFYIIGLVYGILYLKEPTYQNELKEEVVKKGLLADFFDTKHVVECFNVAFKKGPNQRRLR